MAVITKILVVEDQPRQRAILHKWFSQRGYEVEVAATAGDAIALGQTFQPHILLTDWTLQGGRTGLDVAEALCTRVHLPITWHDCQVMLPIQQCQVMLPVTWKGIVIQSTLRFSTATPVHA